MLLNGAGTGAAWVIKVTLPAMPELAKTEVSGSQRAKRDANRLDRQVRPELRSADAADAGAISAW
jgi:hypothetical protein